MRPTLIAFCLAVFTLTATAQSGTPAKPKQAAKQKESAAPQVAPKAQLAAPQVPQGVVKDLPVRKVVLYKNGVGYFEHAGSVTGNQRVAIDFTSPQLNDVLQSLTVLDKAEAASQVSITTPPPRLLSSSKRSLWA